MWDDNLYHSDTWVFDINIHDDVKKAMSDSQGAFVKRVVGVVRLFFEDVIQGVLQILFLAEFWQKLHWTSRAFTISSVVAGLACSAGGPVNEYIAELRHRDDQRRLQQSVERLRSETTLQSSWKKDAIDGTVLPEVLLENQDHEDARGTPAVVAAHAQNRASHKYSAAHPESVQAMDRTVYEDVPDLLTSRTSLYTCLLLLSSGFWLYVALLPYLQASIFETDEHTCHGISAVFKGGFVLLLLSSVAFEYWLIAQTQKGLKYLKHHRLQVAFHVSLTCLGKYDVFSDVAFWVMAKGCGFSQSYSVLLTAIIGIGFLQCLPGMMCLCLRLNWAFAFKFNDCNMLLAATDNGY